MSSIPSSLYVDLEKNLLESGVFDSNDTLKAIFVDERLEYWAYELPEATSRKNRVEITIDFLIRKYNYKQENALVLLLRVLGDRISMQDNRYEKFRRLAKEIQALINQKLCKRPLMAQERLGSQDFVRLLEAMGYHILNKAKIPERNFMFLKCQIKLGMEVRTNIVGVILGSPQLSHVGLLKQALCNLPDYKATLIAQSNIPDEIKEHAISVGIQAYSYDELLMNIIDFTPYLENIIKDYKGSEVDRYYVDLRCISPDGTNMKISQYVSDWLKRPKDKHLSILGNFGTGKTWFCRNFVANQAKNCLQNSSKRIPILITLRDYSKAYDIVQVITDLCANRLKIPLPSGYDTFDFLNKAGRLVIVFDGLDEMERRISDYRTIAENFLELAKVSRPEKSKVILTCRSTYFRHELEEREILAGDGKKVSIISNNKVFNVGTESPYKVTTLMELSINELESILKKRTGEELGFAWRIIQETPNLLDLARKPALVDMLIRVIPEMSIQNSKAEINLAELFNLYIKQSLKRYDHEDFPIELEERLLFLEDLSWKMHVTQNLAINWADFLEHVKKYFKLEHNPESALFFERSLRTQSYLTRDSEGNYSFAHKSFVEFFVAKKIYKLLNEYPLPEGVLVSQISDFVKVFGHSPLPFEVVNFLIKFIQEEEIKGEIKNKLYSLLKSTRTARSQEVKYRVS